MEEQTFLQTLKEVFEQLKEDGIVTQENIDNGFKMPIAWLSSNDGISREAITVTLRNFHRNADSRLKKITKKSFEENSVLVYSEKDGVPYLESRSGNGTIIIADQYNIQLNQSRKNYGEYIRVFLSNEFIRKNIIIQENFKKI